jgi:hypothetical protein
MKNIIPILSAAVLMLSSCSQSTRTAENDSIAVDSVTASAPDSSAAKPLFATMKINNVINAGDSVRMKFTVYNTADSVQHFCKWHTPFEPLMSKYLDVKAANGEEAQYQGAMAKRIMPPPADSYIAVKPGDSLSVDVNLTKGYAITKPGKYSVSYVGQNMSGLVVKDSVAFTYGK